MADLVLVCVDPALIREFWPHARHLIKAAIEYTGLSEFPAIEAQILAGDQLLWLAWNGQTIEAAATTHLIKTAGKPVCELTACAGNERERWLPLFEQIEDYAKKEGCSVMRLFGRKGWEKVLKNYRVEHVVLERTL